MWRRWNTVAGSVRSQPDDSPDDSSDDTRPHTMTSITPHAVRLIATAILFLSHNIAYAVDFGEILLGAEATRAVFAPQDTNGETQWRFLRRVSAPFTLSSETPIDVAGSRAWLCAFQPLSQGTYHDTAIIVQFRERRPVDTITIILSGTGRSLTQHRDVRFFSALTGDLQEKRIDVFGPAYVTADYVLQRGAASPFSIDTSQGLLRADPDDSLEVTLRFQPLLPSSYEDTVRLIRWHQRRIPLDTLTFVLSGAAVQMQADTTVVFRDATVGSIDTTVTFIRLPSFAVSERFRYAVRATSEQPLRIEVDPDRPTRRSVLTLKLIAQPTEYRNQRVEFYLRRFSADSSRVWDSTRINVDLLMRPRPVAFAFQWQADTITASVGDTLQLVLEAVTQTPFDEPLEITGYQLDVAYNPSVLVPLTREGQRRVVDRDTLWWRMDAAQQSINPVGSRTPLDTMYAIVALGDAPFSHLVLRNGVLGIRASDPQIVSGHTAVVKVDDIYSYGSGMQRLVSSLQGALRLVISPNPLTSSGTITLYGAGQDRVRLDIIHVDGSIVVTVDDLPTGSSRSIPISDFNLQPGMYFARCIVQRGLGVPPLRVVRMFRYQ